MMKRFLLLSLTVCTCALQAQHSHNPCITDILYEQELKDNPAIKQAEIEFNELAATYHTNTKRTGTIIIPVVFHVFHNNGPENISKAQILDQLRVLNADYKRLNSDTNKTRPIFKGVAAGLDIEFRLATIDPRGNCTEGIVRKQSLLTENADNSIKKLSVWPTDKYYNIWVVKNINSASAGGGTILGYAQFPFSGSYGTDGVIIRSDMVGTIGTAASPATGTPYMGRTLTHETGHWLGLFHTFQDSCKGGDKVDDTPPVKQASYGACLPSMVNTCNNDNPDLPDQYENYMDYSPGACLNMFTAGQRARMLASIEKYRFILVSSQNLAATGTSAPVAATCKPTAFFKSSTTQACAGNTVTFNDLTYNYTGALTLNWYFKGGTPETSTAANPIVTYTNAGNYPVTLVSATSHGSDTITVDNWISILPKTGNIANFLYEDFENGTYLEHQWQWYSTSVTGWMQTQAASVSGKTSLVVANNNGQMGHKYTLISPTVSLSNTTPTMSFYYSFMQRDKSDGNGGITDTKDELRVYTSTDCGATWQSRWSKSGSTLATTTDYSKFPGISYYPVDLSFWKDATVNLSAIPAAQRSNVRFKFEFTSDGGNNMYLDNVNLGYGTGVTSVSLSSKQLSIYPNPAQQSVSVIYNPLAASGAVSIVLTDMTGKQLQTLYTGTSDGSRIELPGLSLNGMRAGVYFISVTQNGMNTTQKLMITE